MLLSHRGLVKANAPVWWVWWNFFFLNWKSLEWEGLVWLESLVLPSFEHFAVVTLYNHWTVLNIICLWHMLAALGLSLGNFAGPQHFCVPYGIMSPSIADTACIWLALKVELRWLLLTMAILDFSCDVTPWPIHCRKLVKLVYARVPCTMTTWDIWWPFLTYGCKVWLMTFGSHFLGFVLHALWLDSPFACSGCHGIASCRPSHVTLHKQVGIKMSVWDSSQTFL